MFDMKKQKIGPRCIIDFVASLLATINTNIVISNLEYSSSILPSINYWHSGTEKLIEKIEKKDTKYFFLETHYLGNFLIHFHVFLLSCWCTVCVCLCVLAARYNVCNFTAKLTMAWSSICFLVDCKETDYSFTDILSYFAQGQGCIGWRWVVHFDSISIEFVQL